MFDKSLFATSNQIQTAAINAMVVAGGGGGGHDGGGAGGSGIVKIWYSGANRATVTGGTTATVGSFTVHTFTTSGTIAFSS